MHPWRYAPALRTSFAGVALLAGLILAGCTETQPQPPELDFQAIEESESPTVAAPEPASTPMPAPILADRIDAIVRGRSGDGLSVADVRSIIVTSLAVAQGDYSAMLAQAYEAPSGSWSIQHPEGWTIDVAEAADRERTRLAGRLTSQEGQAFASAEVERIDGRGLLTVDASTNDVVLPELALLDDFRLLSRSTQVLWGVFVEELVFSHTSPDGPSIGLMIVTRSNSDLYTVRGETASREFDHFEEQVRAIVYSFRPQHDWSAAEHR